MPDPFDALRAPITPAEPDPAFAARLRERLVRALDLPRGVSVTTTAIPQTTAQLGAVIPRLTVSDGQSAIDWYVRVFGAELPDKPYWMPDGKLGHAELRIGGGALYVADEYPPYYMSPSRETSSIGLTLTVSDVDSTVAEAVSVGGELRGEITEEYGYRRATLIDPFGHRWLIRTALQPFKHGDIAYVSQWVPDADRAADFFGRVLEWNYTGSGPRRHVRDVSPAVGIFGGQRRSTLFCSYAVDDVAAGVAAVRAAGGQADEPIREPFGLVADCTDDQGVRFALVEIGTTTKPSAKQTLEYVTFEVADSARARAFYGAVLGWTFQPGRVSDGWQISGVTPMSGLAGGRDEATTVPMWGVPDIAAAVERVRAAGGTATDPQRQPYGMTAECTDDQGTRFYLGQL